MAPNPIHVCHTLTPSELSILSSGVIEVLLFQGHSCTYESVPDTGSLELHEAPRVFSCHISVVADIWIFMPAQPAPAPRVRVGPAV